MFNGRFDAIRSMLQDALKSVSSNPPRTPASRPDNVYGARGTYTCIFGCTKRFATPALLQKHRREGHTRPQQAPHAPDEDISLDSTNLTTKPGSYWCEWINSSKGRPCNLLYMWPYDLKSHEHTMHNMMVTEPGRRSRRSRKKNGKRAEALGNVAWRALEWLLECGKGDFTKIFDIYIYT